MPGRRNRARRRWCGRGDPGQPTSAGCDRRHRQEHAVVQKATSAHVVPPELGHRYHSSCDRLGVQQTDLVLVRVSGQPGGTARALRRSVRRVKHRVSGSSLRLAVMPAGQPVVELVSVEVGEPTSVPRRVSRERRPAQYGGDGETGPTMTQQWPLTMRQADHRHSGHRVSR